MDEQPLEKRVIEPLSPQIGIILASAGTAQAQETPLAVPALTRKHATNSTRKRTQAAKERMIKALEKTMCTVSLAARLAGIDRGTHYHWLVRDSKYKEAVWEVHEVLGDTLESIAYTMALEKNPTVLLATLRAKCKDRGWGDGPQTAMQVNQGLKLEIVEPRELTFDQIKKAAQRALEARYGKNATSSAGT